MGFGDLRGILQYVPQFRGKTFVIAIDGEVAASEVFSNVLLDVAVLESLSVRVVLVLGAGRQVVDLGKARGVELSSIDGRGVTDAATHEVVMDAVSRLNLEVLRQLASSRIQAATPNAIHGHSEGVVKGVDHQFTGRVSWVDSEALTSLIDSRMVPVIPPLVITSGGNQLRANSDAVARKVAAAVGADKLIFLCGGPVPILTGERPHYAVAKHDAAALAEKLDDEWRSRIDHARRACEDGVARAHFLNGMESDALLAEVFSNEGVGLMVFADNYLQLRKLEERDVPELVSMMRNSVADDALVARSATEILERLDDYRVIVVDDNIVGSVALHFYDGSDAAELACLYVKRDHENQGYARKLVEHALALAADAGVSRVVALTTRAKDYFVESLGFSLGSESDLPTERAEKLQVSGRRSLVMIKQVR
ncbi:amino-acid N-acetyltransferase [Sulfuriroseicoccus oceanibius]|uniref:amino-acid N-acetyltransferase n=1 Tax=Sulfuriroseicoccus oceanibius TaxID=2707525 RepID=A0A6B3L9I1_9BACT|nr:amino-acid N-acetyltransferase [Sulfuriroseicoccus oceanibius]QQL44188.1 amino-acid N-acetyltransferase [Sulfuriroseicoccus oceanibius]